MYVLGRQQQTAASQILHAQTYTHSLGHSNTHVHSHTRTLTCICICKQVFTALYMHNNYYCELNIVLLRCVPFLTHFSFSLFIFTCACIHFYSMICMRLYIFNKCFCALPTRNRQSPILDDRVRQLMNYTSKRIKNTQLHTHTPHTHILALIHIHTLFLYICT